LSDSNTASGVISNVGFDLSPQTFSQTSNLGLTGWSVAYACDPGNPSCALTSFSVGGTKFKATSGNKTYTASSFNLTRYFLDTVTTQLIGPPQEGRQINYFKDSSVTIEEVATRGGATVPAPATITLMSLGVVGMAGMRRRARQAHRRR
jgi:hypothetical protein